MLERRNGRGKTRKFFTNRDSASNDNYEATPVCQVLNKAVAIHSLKPGLVERQEKVNEKKNQEFEAKSFNNVVNAVNCKSRQGTRTAWSCQPLRPSKGLTGGAASQPSLSSIPQVNRYPSLFKETDTDHSAGFAVVPFTHTVAVMENSLLATSNDTG